MRTGAAGVRSPLRHGLIGEVLAVISRTGARLAAVLSRLRSRLPSGTLRHRALGKREHAD
jgi:hypothetical protein